VRTVAISFVINKQKRKARRRRKPLQRRREAWQLTFWAIERVLSLSGQALRLVLLAVVVAYSVEALIGGHLPWGLGGIIQALTSK
jgi:hypothetical protein